VFLQMQAEPPGAGGRPVEGNNLPREAKTGQKFPLFWDGNGAGKGPEQGRVSGKEAVAVSSRRFFSVR